MKIKKNIKSPVVFLLLFILAFSFAFKVNYSINSVKQKQASLQQKSEDGADKTDNGSPIEETENDSELEDGDVSDQFFTAFLFFEDPSQILIHSKGTNHFISASTLEAGKSEIPVYLANRTIRV